MHVIMLGLPACNTTREYIHIKREVHGWWEVDAILHSRRSLVHCPLFDVEEDDAGNFIKGTL